jgi:hypothetical protein
MLTQIDSRGEERERKGRGRTDTHVVAEPCGEPGGGGKPALEYVQGARVKLVRDGRQRHQPRGRRQVYQRTPACTHRARLQLVLQLVDPRLRRDDHPPCLCHKPSDTHAPHRQ